MWCGRLAAVFAALILLLAVPARAGTVVSFADGSPAAVVSRLRAIDLTRLEADLASSGLALPPRIDVLLLSNDDPRGRGVPPWIVGLALEPTGVVIFPERVLPYPYDSLESVFRHEVTHLALSSRAGGRPLPRWLHEGVAMSVDADWHTMDRLRLALAMTGNRTTADVARLFASGSQTDSAEAYGLSAALVADLEQRHGRTAPARMAARVAAGVPFPDAFAQEAGETPDQAAARAWRAYGRWAVWMSAITSDTAIWGVIVTLALAGSVVQMRRRARRRAKWDEPELLDLEEP